MIVRISSILLFLSSYIMSPYVQAAPTIQNWQSEKGANVYFVAATELPMVDIQIIFDAGSARNGKKAGLAGLTNGLLDEGAGGLTADQISQGFDKLGANYGASAGYDSAMVSLRSLSDPAILDPALENLARVLVKPDFPEDALRRQKNRTLVGIAANNSLPGHWQMMHFLPKSLRGILMLFRIQAPKKVYLLCSVVMLLVFIKTITLQKMRP